VIFCSRFTMKAFFGPAMKRATAYLSGLEYNINAAASASLHPSA